MLAERAEVARVEAEVEHVPKSVVDAIWRKCGGWGYMGRHRGCAGRTKGTRGTKESEKSGRDN